MQARGVSASLCYPSTSAICTWASVFVCVCVCTCMCMGVCLWGNHIKELHRRGSAASALIQDHRPY